MKNSKNYSHLTVCKPRQPLYPNAADPSYFVGKLLDILTAIVSGVGLIIVMIFLVHIS